MPQHADPLSPLAGWVRVLLAFVALMVVCGVFGALTGSSAIMGFGNVASICVEEPVGGTVEPGEPLLPHDLRAGVDTYRIGYAYCASDPDLPQRVWYTLTLLPTAALFAAVLVILFRLVRGAARDGIHTNGTARRLRGLGWVLITGSVLAPIAEDAASVRLLATMVNDPIGGYFMPNGAGTWAGMLPLVLVGVGLLTFSRFVLVGAEMRADLDATV
jgi:Protein of unknown function (DUF2975)